MPLKTICLPAGTEHVQFGELAHLIANALHPLSDGATDGEMLAHGGARINLESELKQAVNAGTLPVKDSLTFGPHTYPVGDALRRSLVMVPDLRAFLAGRPVTVEIAPELDDATPEPQAAPVVTEGISVVTHSTKARRDTLTPVIELAQRQCRNPKDTAEVWAALLVLAEKKSAPLIGATEEGLQYLNNGSADIFKRDSLRKRLSR